MIVATTTACFYLHTYLIWCIDGRWGPSSQQCLHYLYMASFSSYIQKCIAILKDKENKHSKSKKEVQVSNIFSSLGMKTIALEWYNKWYTNNFYIDHNLFVTNLSTFLWDFWRIKYIRNISICNHTHPD